MTMASGEQARPALADALVEAGHQFPSSSHGIHGRGADF